MYWFILVIPLIIQSLAVELEPKFSTFCAFRFEWNLIENFINTLRTIIYQDIAGSNFIMIENINKEIFWLPQNWKWIEQDI